MFEQGGHIHPLKYALGLADAAKTLNVDIYENTKAIKISEERNHVEVRTAKGIVKAKNVWQIAFPITQ